MNLKPSKPDLIVRDPQTSEPLPAAGAEKPLSTFWRRRLKVGDVVEVVASKGDK